VADVISILSRLDGTSVIDILLVSLIFFWMFRLIQGTHAVPLLRGVIIIVVITVVITNLVKLTAFTWLLRNTLPALLVAIPVVFQPELRRLLERLGRGSAGGFLSLRLRETAFRQVVEKIAQACMELSQARHGALIVLERETGLQDIIETGVLINAEVSREMLLTLFYPKSALHDGAAIIRGDRIVAASCVLPLSTTSLEDRNLGTRHRAALGVTESSDAIAIVVSEETGIISIAHGGRLIRRLDEGRFIKVLMAFYRPRPERPWYEWLKRLRGKD
jgi:diadenylate cyclase